MRDLVRLIALFRPYLGWLALGILLSFVTFAANVVLLAISGWFITAMALAGLAGVSMNYFTPAAIIRAMAILRTGGRYAERLVTHEATFRLIAELRGWFYERMEPLAPAGLQAYRSGDLLSRLRGDIDRLETFYLRVIVPFGVAALALPLAGLFLWGYSRSLAAAFVVSALTAGIALPLMVERRARSLMRRQVLETARLRAELVELLQGTRELQVFGAFARRRKRIESLSRRLIGEQQRLAAHDGLAQAALGLIINLTVWLALLLLIPLVGSGAIEPPMLAALTLFTLAAFEAVQPLPAALRFLPGVEEAARRLFSLADQQPLVIDPQTPAVGPICGDIELRGVSFAYGDDAAPVLRDVDLVLPHGKRIAIIGPSGAGKSSLVNLLLRFWPATSGQLLVDGRPIETYAAEDLRALFAVAPQHNHLFNTTMAANLRLAKPDASDGELFEACRIACLDELLGRLPQGLATFVGEAGTRLSGGEIRRVGIARAVLKPALVLILDEPGEGLDATTERQLMANIREALGDRSLLLITHSPVGLDWMDAVWRLEAGEVTRAAEP